MDNIFDKKLSKIIRESIKLIVEKRLLYENRENEIFKVPKNEIREFGVNAISKKKKYARIAWEMIQNNYKSLGGCKTFDDMNGDGGFNDFLYGKYIWRIYFGDNSNKLLGISVYKPTKFGRKIVCVAAINKGTFNTLLVSDLDKSTHTYGEVSGKPEHILNNNPKVNWIPNGDASHILGKQVNVNRDEKIDALEEIPYRKGIHYTRDIGGTPIRKGLFGNPIPI